MSGPHSPAPEEPGGILIVAKPAGPTSHDVVARVQSRFRFRKVGHAGTLDPSAEGVLILGLGRRATRRLGFYQGLGKEYLASLELGVSTDTQDADGEVTARGEWRGVTEEALRGALAELAGARMQVPPMFSALKRKGKPLYRLARRGVSVERKARPIVIEALELVEFAPPAALLRVRCSKGTYVRTLCAEIGEALGCGAHMRALTRTRVGEFTLERALSLDALLAMTREEMEKRMLPVEEES